MSPVRHAALVYHVVRQARRHRGVALVRAGRVLRRESVCRLVGHDWSWPLAVQLGTTGRPVCERCLTAGPRGGADAS